MATRSHGELLAGLDEVGRGPLAGPVIAAAVMLDPARPIRGLDDSKKLTARRREALASRIEGCAIGFAIGRAEVNEIDRLNILQASLLAMQRAVLSLALEPKFALVDGRICPDLPCSSEAVVGGDAKVAEIAAASILAKVARDREMLSLHEHYPRYGFSRNKGYPTREHLRRLRAGGASPVHRRSFAPVRGIIQTSRYKVD